jgi:hypothetical protein
MFGALSLYGRGDDLGHARRRLQAGGPFKRVEKGTYALTEKTTANSTSATQRCGMC